MSVPALAAEVGARFDHVLVDEYQDTNKLQASIVRLLKPEGRGVTVVGDDAQAIYGFRAATVRNILDFPGQYTPPAAVITLDRNYRSTEPILDRVECGDRPREGTLHQGPRGRPAIGRAAAARHRARRIGAGAIRGGAGAPASRERHRSQAPGGAVSHVEPQRPARARACKAQHPVREIRRPSLPRCRARQGRAVDPALDRESAGTARGIPRAAAAARGRARDGDALARCARRHDRTHRNHARIQGACGGRAGMGVDARSLSAAARARQRLAGRDGCAARLVPAAARAHVRRRAAPVAGPRPTPAHRRRPTQVASGSSPS